VQKTLIDGRVLFDRDKDIAGRPALEKEKKDLIAKEKAAAKRSEEKKGENSAKPEEKKAEEKPNLLPAIVKRAPFPSNGAPSEDFTDVPQTFCCCQPQPPFLRICPHADSAGRQQPTPSLHAKIFTLAGSTD
jgi:hypothetical protein